MKSDKKYADLNSFISFLKNTAPNGTYPGDEINYVAENIQKDADVILYASLSYDKAIQFADNKLKSDKIFLENRDYKSELLIYFQKKGIKISFETKINN